MVQTVINRKFYTADEFLALPEDGYRYELVNGQIKQLDTSSMRHGLVTVQCGAVLKIACDKNKAGSVFIGSAYVLDYQNVVSPDISFVSTNRMSGIDLDEVTRITPDLAIEVISRSETTGDIQDKIERYQAVGTKLNWSI